MLVIVFGIFTAIIIMLMSFVAYSPNLGILLQQDFERQLHNNMISHAIARGQIMARANNLSAAGTTFTECFYHSGVLEDVSTDNRDLARLDNPALCQQSESFVLSMPAGSHSIDIRLIPPH